MARVVTLSSNIASLSAQIEGVDAKLGNSKIFWLHSNESITLRFRGTGVMMYAPSSTDFVLDVLSGENVGYRMSAIGTKVLNYTNEGYGYVNVSNPVGWAIKCIFFGTTETT